ncbi:family 18 putative glycoside hydrolase [Triangularia verruculosa]|uniref:Family 18 putative glycoside hydrolase n=1 Tax=Triangularia verruculosa TaxID=2587418 RepID=A0AAN6XHA2_9PEZI|nr:family 18 putative glycoside hydrolase [Triangularia verruculosa]
MKSFILYTTLALGGLTVTAAPLEQGASVPAPIVWHDKHTVVEEIPAHGVSTSSDDAAKEFLRKRQLDTGSLVQDLGLIPSPEEDQVEKRQTDNTEGQLQKRQADPSVASLFGSPQKLLEYFASLNPPPRQPNLLDVLIGDLSGVVPAVTGLLDGVLDLLLPPVPSPAVPRVAEPTFARQYSPDAVLSALSSLGYPRGTGLGLATTTVCVATATIPVAGFPTITLTKLTTVTAGPIPIIVQGLTALEGAIASVLNEVIPSQLLPGVTIAASANLPSGLNPAISLTVPGLSIPAITLPPLPTVTVTLPWPSIPSIPLPSLSVPSIQLPSVSIPALPSLSLPVLPPVPTLPSLSLPSISVPSIPFVSTERVHSNPPTTPEHIDPKHFASKCIYPDSSANPERVSSKHISPAGIVAECFDPKHRAANYITTKHLTADDVFAEPVTPKPYFANRLLAWLAKSRFADCVVAPSLPTVSLPSLSLPSVALPTRPATLLPGVTIPGAQLPGLTVSPPPGLTISVGGISANLPVIGTVGIPPLINLTLRPSGLTAPGLSIPTVVIPPLVIPTPVQAILPNILSQLSRAVATETPLVPGLIAAINGLIPIPTPVVTRAIGGNIPIPTGAPLLPSLLSEIGAAASALPSAVPNLLSSLEQLLLPEPTFSILPFPPLPNPPVQPPPLSILPFPPIATRLPNLPNLPILTALPTITFPPLPTAKPTVSISTRPPPFINLGPPIPGPNIIASLIPLPTSPANNPRSYRFNALSNTNVAVYYGQSSASERISLAATCADANVDLVVLGFITDINYQDCSLPRLSLAPMIKGVKTPYQQRLAPGLDYYAQLEADIRICQRTYGKKVLLSLGGGGSQLVLKSEDEATRFANWLWKLFGPVTQGTTRGNEVVNGLRPFGRSVIDGFDLAKLDNAPNYWGTFAARVRKNFLLDRTKQYFLSAAPGFVSPDPSIPIGYLAQANFIWPRFFGDPTGRCDLGGDNFLTSILQWTRLITEGIRTLGGSTTAIARTKFFIGIPAWAEAAPNAYARLGGARAAGSLAIQLRGLGLKGFFNLGGVMVFDGPEGIENVQEGRTILDWVKGGLNGTLVG